jgi:cyanophycinase-like exopeptidase
MTERRLILIAIIVCGLSPLLSSAPQARYDYYLTGNAADAAGRTTLGIGLMGGGTDVDALFTWMSERAGGGDFVVIRASGADGYNQYVYDLGDFDSIETLVLQNRDASFDPDVLRTILNAEALFIAGGDQSDYVDFWKGTPVEAAIHALAAKRFRSPAPARERRS